MDAEIVNELTDRGYKCRFTSLLAILNDLSALVFDNRRNYMNQLCERDLLVLDDLGAELDSGYSNQVLMQIVTLCHRNLTPIIVTKPYHREHWKRSHLTELIIAKHRNGPTGKIKLFFKDDCTKFLSLNEADA